MWCQGKQGFVAEQPIGIEIDPAMAAEEAGQIQLLCHGTFQYALADEGALNLAQAMAYALAVDLLGHTEEELAAIGAIAAGIESQPDPLHHRGDEDGRSDIG